MTEAEIISSLEEKATNAKKVETSSGTVEQHSISDQIKAAEYLDRKRTVSNNEGNARRILFGGMGRIAKLG